LEEGAAAQTPAQAAAAVVLKRKRGLREVIGSPSLALGDTPVAGRTRAGKKLKAAAAAPTVAASSAITDDCYTAEDDEEPAKKRIKIIVKNAPTPAQVRTAVVQQRAESVVREFMEDLGAKFDSGSDDDEGTGSPGNVHSSDRQDDAASRAVDQDGLASNGSGHSSDSHDDGASRAPAIAAGPSQRQSEKDSGNGGSDQAHVVDEPVSRERAAQEAA
jgi:hypothetical protein